MNISRSAARASILRAKYFCIFSIVVLSFLILCGIFDYIHPMGWGHDGKILVGLVVMLASAILFFLLLELVLRLIIDKMIVGDDEDPLRF